jgi:predicted aminopeptidase
MAGKLLYILVVVVTLSGCTGLRFVIQGAQGQLRLSDGVELAQAIADPNTDARTRRFLQEVQRIKAYARANGLHMHSNYEEFVRLDQDYVIWFVNASEPLAFVPKTFSFPLVGSFPGLSWFCEQDALKFADELKEDGWDVNIRGVRAFSTGGWFSDPIVSSMFAEHPAALGLLVNTLLHESVHATVLVSDQQFFNESLAGYIGNTATPEYLAEYYGPNSTELKLYEDAVQTGEVNTQKLGQAVEELTALYMSPLPDAQKLEHKDRTMHRLQRELELEFLPNNATLIGFQLYHEGTEDFDALYATCGQSWPRFIRATESLRPRHFDAEQTSNIGPTIQRLIGAGCEPLPPPQRSPVTRQSRQRLRRITRFHTPR